MQKIMDMFQKIAKSAQTSISNLLKQKITYIYIAVLAFIVPALFCEWLVLPALAIVLTSAIFVKFDDILALVFFLYAFFAVFIFKGINTYFLLFAGVVCVFAVRYLIEVIKDTRKIDWLLVGLVIAYCVYIMLPIRKTVNGEFSSVCSIKNIASIGVFFVLLYLCYIYKNELNFLKILRMFMIGFLIAGTLGLFVFVSDRLENVIPIIYYHGFDLMRFSGLFQIPNTLAIFASVVFALSLYLIYSKTIHIAEAHIYAICSFVLGYVTLARSFLYSAIICFVIFVIAMIIRDKKNFYKTILPLLAEIAIVMLVFFKFSEVHFKRADMSDLVNGYDNLASSEKLETVSDPGRGGLIKKYVKDYLSSALIILFGRGMSFDWLGGLSSHNTFLQGIWNTGLVGVVLLLIIAFVFLKKFTNASLWQNIKDVFVDVGLYLFLIPILAIMFIENLFMNMQMIILVMLVIFAILKVKQTRNIMQKNQDE